MPRYVLDTTALVTIFQHEPGADLVLGILADATASGEQEGESDAEPTRVHVPFMALMELDYLSRQRLGEEEARRVCDLARAWPVEIVESGESWRREAARIKATCRLSLADAWICSLALLLGAELVHKDPEYDAVEQLLCRRLPYKSVDNAKP